MSETNRRRFFGLLGGASALPFTPPPSAPLDAHLRCYVGRGGVELWADKRRP